jgi:DNA end-binding protein Ku
MKPVGFQRYNKETGEDVAWDDIVKGSEYEKDRYVVLTEEDFRRANVEATQTVEILSFVDREEIAPMYYETPYYLAPDKRGHKGYALLRETLKQTGKVAMATVVIRTRQYVAALIPYKDVILIVPPSNLKTVGVSSREVEMAQRLVEGMSAPWKPEEHRDTYHEDLLALIEKRVEAGQTEVVTEPSKDEGKRAAKGEVIDLMALLKKSVEAKGKRRGPQAAKATRARKSGRKAA